MKLSVFQNALVFFIPVVLSIFPVSCLMEFGPHANGPTDYSNVELSYDRSQFGNAPFPFWFNLKPSEILALQNVDKAKAGDADEILALALLASGNVRDSTTFVKYTGRVQRFVDAARPKLEAQRDFWQKGHALFAMMRREFLKTDSTDDLAGYDWYQSRLSTLLETGKYNCVSSAILYIILARYFDMPVKAVVLPSHVFVQMSAPDGKIIEIETTARTGFDWIHDEKYYKTKALNWLSLRSLPQSTYEDYKSRRIMEPYRVVCYNMTNQHTAPSVMKFEDIHRLKEMIGYILDDDSAAQRERLAIYGLEFEHCHKHQDFATARRLFATIMPAVMAAKQRFPGNADVVKNAVVLEYNDATMLLELRRQAEFAVQSKSVLDELEKSGKADTSEMYKAVLVNVYNFIRYCMDDKKDFAAAESLAVAFVPYAKDQEWFLGNVISMYGMAMRPAWDKKDWPEVIRIVKKQKAIDVGRKYAEMLSKNIEAAYATWSISYSNDGNWPKAKDVLKQCHDDCASCAGCDKMLDELEKEHRY